MAWTAAAAIAVGPKPNVTSMVPVTAEVSPQPMALPKTMKPFSRPCSLTGVTSIAMPSTATSCVAANTLIKSPRTVSRPTCSAGLSTRTRLKNDSVMPSCAPSTQGRRLPIGGNWYRSINGPDKSLKAQGKMMTASSEAIWPAPTP